MPELPDLQVFSHNLTKILKGKELKKITIVYTKKIKVPQKEFKNKLEKQSVRKVYREGKELRFEFSNGNILGMHLMLKGQLYLYEKKNEHKRTIAELLFTDGIGLALDDYQGQATITLNPEISKTPDALSKETNLAFFKRELATTGTTIKNFLLDQHKLRGIGNAYADEILWDARISPFSVCRKIPEEKIKQLVKSIKKILKWAEKQVNKFAPGTITGESREFLPIHNSKNRRSPNGAPILTDQAGGRKTYYTKEQKLYK